MLEPITPPGTRHEARGTLLLLLLIVVIAALLRFWNLSGVPLGFFRDEAEKGYTAYQLWHTGRQGMFLPGGGMETTQLFPAFVEAGYVHTSAIYQYLSAPVVGLFGLKVWTTRLAAALCGLLTVVAGFFLARRIESGAHSMLWKREATVVSKGEQRFVCLTAALFIALSPTHILFSRWAQQGITVPLWTTLGLLLLLGTAAAARKHQRSLAIGGGFFMALAFYSYDPARLVIPLLLLGLWAEMGRDFPRLAKLYWPAAIVFFLIAIPVAHFNVTTGSGRFSRISVFADQSLSGALINALGNYLQHFNPLFLFTHGDSNVRHHLSHSGLIAWAETPFFILGLVTLLGWKRPGARLLLFWLLAAPAAASLTNDGIPHALRSILFFPVVHLISARGAGLLWRLTKPRAAIAALLCFAAATLALNAYALIVIAPRQHRDWQYGVLEALDVMWRENPQGPNVLSAEVPYAIYYALFHEQLAPEDFQEYEGQTLRTLILPPGTPLPNNSLVARPGQLFERAGGMDVWSPVEGGEGVVMKVRREW